MWIGIHLSKIGFKNAPKLVKLPSSSIKRTLNDNDPINRNVTGWHLYRWPLLHPRAVCSSIPIWVSERKVGLLWADGTLSLCVFTFTRLFLPLFSKPARLGWNREGLGHKWTSFISQECCLLRIWRSQIWAFSLITSRWCVSENVHFMSTFVTNTFALKVSVFLTHSSDFVFRKQIKLCTYSYPHLEQSNNAFLFCLFL